MPPDRKRVLVVEDDVKTADIVKAYLEKDGYDVVTAHDGRDGLNAARHNSPDLIVLDLLLPGMGGLDICRTLRSESSVPIIMLTALTTELDKLAGLDLGADDYVTKPFSPRELVARVRAVLRRTAEEKTSREPAVLTYGDVSLDLEQCAVSIRGQEIYLTPTEFRLLAVLVREPGRVFSRTQLVEKALGYDYDGLDRTVDVHILNLRRKIEQDPNHPEYIRTVYGMGYKFGG
jgi:two-component system, OmpR family, alkaline phosphatase synthesis response regulator PhoP